MSFYHFSQNNSGGDFHFDEVRGITHHVVIEARSPGEANLRAQAIGLYFDGVADDRDCACCGDRWHEAGAYRDGGTQVPEVYGEPASTYVATFHWMPAGREIAVHYADGRIEWHGAAEKQS